MEVRKFLLAFLQLMLGIRPYQKDLANRDRVSWITLLGYRR
jgi:hypothetical protein